MTKEENIATLNEHLDHWKRLLSEKICDQDEGEKTIDALHNAIKVLEQEPFEELDFVQPHKKVSVNLEVRKMREATQEEREGVEMYIDSIADIVPSKWIAEDTCEDCISRQEAIDLADELKDDLPDDDRLSDMVMSHNEGILEYQTKLSLLSPVTPAEKMGRWIYDRTRDRDGECKYECSECGMGSDVDYAYCMRCGCKMQEVEG